MAARTEPSTRSSTWSPGRIVAVVTVLALVLFWIWVFAGGPRKPNPDRLADRAWVERAEQRCATTARFIAGLPPAESSAKAADRADVVDRASTALSEMLDRLEDPPPTDLHDARLVRQWIADWRTYMGNRRDYADHLRRDPRARFLVDEKFSDPIDTVITTFADVNSMGSCAPPGDIA